MLISILRTIVPALWGSVIGRALTLLPVLEPLRAELLAYGDFAVPVIAAVIIGGWYAAGRWLEQQAWMPDWLTRILLGSAKSPVYEPTVRVGIDPSLIEARIAEVKAEYEISDPHEPTSRTE